MLGLFDPDCKSRPSPVIRMNGFAFNYSNDEGLGFWTLQSYFFEIHRQNHHCLSPTTIPLSGRYLNFVNYAHTIFFSDLEQIAQLCRMAQSGAWGSPQQARNRRSPRKRKICGFRIMGPIKHCLPIFSVSLFLHQENFSIKVSNIPTGLRYK